MNNAILCAKKDGEYSHFGLSRMKTVRVETLNVEVKDLFI